jgi:hypothetical protein
MQQTTKDRMPPCMSAIMVCRAPKPDDTLELAAETLETVTV